MTKICQNTMSEEKFDIVDQYDQVIGQQTRSQVHQLGLRHRAVYLLVFNNRGQLFLQKRSMSKDCSPGLWDASASGHVDTGEDYDTAVIREAREELGIILTDKPEKLLKINASTQTAQEFVWLYRYQHQGPFQLHPEEISDGDWFSQKKINKWITNHTTNLTPSFVFIWKKYEQHLAHS